MNRSSVISADEAEFTFDRSCQDIYVKFTPIYTLLVRIVQFSVCTACMTGFDTHHPALPLAFIIFTTCLPTVFR